MLDILVFLQNKCRLDYDQGKAAPGPALVISSKLVLYSPLEGFVMWHCVGFACELPLKALRYPEPQLYSMSQCFPFLCKDYALWFDIMFNFLYLLLQIPSRIVWNTSLQVWRSMIWCKDREDRIRVYEEGWKPLEKETPRFQSSCKLPPKHPWSLQPALIVVWKIQSIALSGSCCTSPESSWKLIVFEILHPYRFFPYQKEVLLN